MADDKTLAFYWITFNITEFLNIQQKVDYLKISLTVLKKLQAYSNNSNLRRNELNACNFLRNKGNTMARSVPVQSLP